ncbi:MAG: hypothetical protein HY847_09740 [Betaproteobacteria bacterium]|nr:hypothetical protein [Betaproteobacteria bacterium]
MDAIVSTDNVVANLACMLGKPTFVLLPKKPDYRWWDGKKSPWYPTARLYRQDVALEWGKPIKLLTADLSAYLANLGTGGQEGW